MLLSAALVEATKVGEWLISAAQLERARPGGSGNVLSSSIGRPVNFVIFGSVSGATGRTLRIVAPG